jgi:glutamate-1-semialdehyde 2,1-aminomutase
MTSRELLAKFEQKFENAYRKRTPKSRAANEKARRYMPGGETRMSIYFHPYPLWIDNGRGCRFKDLDGNEYIDFNNCYSALVLGHANPKVMKAVKEQIMMGTAHPALMPIVIRWAELLCRRVKSVERVRFTNSGTEAVMMAIRVARAFTGKDKIIKIEGGYYGSYDSVVYPSNAAGLPKSILADSITIPYNDEQAAERALHENNGQLAAIIVEGMMGAAGQISPKDGYLRFLRKATSDHDVLLILDEVQSLRLDYGGIQNIFGIKPDLTAFGKLIGGGFPVGAFGGRKDIMDFCSSESEKVYHSGTFNGNPVTAIAGITTLEQLTAKEIARINNLGESITKGVFGIFDKLGIKGQVTGRGSLRNLHFSQVPVVDGKTAMEANKDIQRLLHLALMERGIFVSSRTSISICTPMAKKEIDRAIKAIEDALSELKPSIEQIWPELIN